MYVFNSLRPFCDYDLSKSILVKSNLCGSRPAGSFFAVDGSIYRPAQDCHKVYGGGIIINKLESLDDQNFQEEFVLAMEPQSNIYNIEFTILIFIIIGLSLMGMDIDSH